MPGRLDDHQVEAGRLERGDHVIEGLGQLLGAASRQRPEVHLARVERVHADAVAEQRSAALAPRRVDGDDSHPQLVLLVEPEPPQQLVGQRRLARAAGAGDPEDGHAAPARYPPQLLQLVFGKRVALQGGDEPGQRPLVPAEDVLQRRRPIADRVDVAGLDHRVDHPGQSEALPVLRGEDLLDAIGLEFGDLLRDDGPAAAAVDLHVGRAPGPQLVDQVLEVLDVAALIGRHRHALHVLMEAGDQHLIHRTVVAQMDHLGTLRLQDAPHDVDRGVVAVEQAGGRDEPDRVGGRVKGRLGHASHNSRKSYYLST